MTSLADPSEVVETVRPEAAINAIAGALKDTIHQHGPIADHRHCQSAAKRIYAQLAGLDTEGYWRSRYLKLRAAMTRKDIHRA